MSTSPTPPALSRDLLTVAHVMSVDPLMLRDDMRIEAAANLLADHGYTGAPVVDHRGELCGVLHALDVAIMHLPPPDVVPARLVLVRHLVRPAVTIAPISPVHVAADRMRTHRTDRLVVVEHDVHVVGLVTGQDLLRTVTLQGNLLRKAVDGRIAALGCTKVTAAVEPTGVVLLTGTIDSLDARDRLVQAIGAIGGVTEVDEFITIVPAQP